MRRFLARARVILTAAPTWLVFASTAVAVAADEISKVVPTGWQDNLVAISGRAVAVIGAAVAIVRRVTPVLPAERGILPPPNPRG